MAIIIEFPGIQIFQPGLRVTMGLFKYYDLYVVCCEMALKLTTKANFLRKSIPLSLDQVFVCCKGIGMEIIGEVAVLSVRSSLCRSINGFHFTKAIKHSFLNDQPVWSTQTLPSITDNSS